MSKSKVVITRKLGPDAMTLLQEASDVEVVIWQEDRTCERTWLLENAKGSSGIALTLLDKVDDELLDTAGPSLKTISTMSVGYEHVPVPALAKRNIRLGYTPDVLTDAVADVSILLALMVGRNVRQITSIVANGDWPNHPWSPFIFVGPQLSGDAVPEIERNSVTFGSISNASKGITAGFLGFGRIAQATVKRLIAFGISNFIYTGNPSSPVDPSADAKLAYRLSLPPGSITRVSLEELASRSDIVFILAPGGPSTHHIVSSDFLSRMKKTSILVNVARGTLVDSDALANALREERIWGAGLDVVEGEPNVPKDHPLVREPRCVILPHVGSATFETRKAMAVLCARNVLAGVRGETMPVELDLYNRK